jgi:hypothetical protein
LFSQCLFNQRPIDVANLDGFVKSYLNYGQIRVESDGMFVLYAVKEGDSEDASRRICSVLSSVKEETNYIRGFHGDFCSLEMMAELCKLVVSKRCEWQWIGIWLLTYYVISLMSQWKTIIHLTI